MKRDAFRNLIRTGPVILDGGSGTWMQSNGLPIGVCPEIWALDHPDMPDRMQQEYYLAGAHIAVTFTFGANAPKLGHYGIGEDQVEEINRRVASQAVRNRDRMINDHGVSSTWLVSGDIGPTGLFLIPAGDLSMGELIRIYRQQVRGLLAGGVDLFSVETMIDLGQMLAAVRAIRMECDLPILATMTFDKSGRTLSGNSPDICAVALEAAGVDAIGANCSTGPSDMGRLLADLQSVTRCPVIIKPNAGMPEVEEGRTVFRMGADDFAQAMQPLVTEGIARVAGGCCGTTPAHIAALVKRISQQPADWTPPDHLPERITSARERADLPTRSDIQWQTVDTPDDLQDAVLEGLELDAPFVGLDVRSLTDFDRNELSTQLAWAQMLCTLPLVFRSDDTELLDLLTRETIGRPGVVTERSGFFNGAAVLAD